MSANPRQLIERQIHRVRRRLWLRQLMHTMVGFWAAGLLLCAAWFLARPFLANTSADWARWGLPAGILAGATLAAILWSWLRAPHYVAASLALDEEFELKERVTTFTMLSAEQAGSPAGQALLADVRDKVANLDVPSKFPLRLRWSAGLAPAIAGVLAIAASFFNPSFSGATNRANPKQASVIDPKEVQQQLDNLRKVMAKDKQEDDLPKSKELEELEREWEKLVHKPLDPSNKDQVRERTNELAKLEDKIQKRVEDLKDKNGDLKKHLDKLQLDKLGKKLQDGPAKDLEDALAKGKFDKAKDILEKLKKDLESGKMSKDELKKLGEQMKDLQDKLKRLTDQKEKQDELQKDFDEGKITKEQLDRELADLKKEAEEMQDLDDLAELLGQCKECLGGADGMKAGQRIKGMLEKLKAMELSESELKRLLSDQDLLKDALDALLMQCNGDCDANGKCNVLSKKASKFPGGRRPVGEDPNSKAVDARERAQTDPTGQQFITGFSRGGTFKKIPSTEVGGAFQRAAQDAPEAIERQRIPSEAEAQVRGYFNKLGRQ